MPVILMEYKAQYKPEDLNGYIKYLFDKEKMINNICGFYECSRNSIEEDFYKIWVEYMDSKSRKDFFHQFIISFDDNEEIDCDLIKIIAHRFSFNFLPHYQHFFVVHQSQSKLHIHFLFNNYNSYDGNSFQYYCPYGYRFINYLYKLLIYVLYLSRDLFSARAYINMYKNIPKEYRDIYIEEDYMSSFI